MPTSPVGVDADGDGFSPPEDCDDSNPDAYPGAYLIPGPDRCLGTDLNCDGEDDGGGDADGDGVPSCDQGECDDNDPQRFPGNPDPLGDGIDQDCDWTDGQALRPTPFIEGTAIRGAIGNGLAVADVNGDLCDDLVYAEAGPFTISEADPYEAAVVYARLGCTEPPVILSYASADPSIGCELSVWHRPEGDAIVAVGRDDSPSSLHVIDFTTAPPTRLGALYGIESGDVRHAVVVHGPDQDELVVTSMRGLNPGPARAWTLPLSAADTFDAPGRLWWDAPTDVVAAFSTTAVERQGYESDVLVTNTASLSAPGGQVHVLEAPGLLSPSELWGGDLAGLCEVFGEHLHDGQGLLGPQSTPFLAGCGLDASDRGVLAIVPDRGPGEYEVSDLATILHGEHPWDLFGRSAAHGDFDGDGDEDLAVGAPTVWPGLPIDGPSRIRTLGGVYLFDGPFLAGEELDRLDARAVWTGESVGDFLGWSLAAGDLDGDGVDEIYVGAPMRASTDPDGEPIDYAGAIYRLSPP